jgi:putative transposase
MSQSLARVLVHVVYSTRGRRPLIVAEHRPRLFAYLAGTLNALECPVVTVGGVADHVHLLFVLSRTLPLSKVVEEVKKQSSKWAKEHVHPDFYWQNGFGAFSVSPSNVPEVTAYIDNQEQHHRTTTYQDELRELLQRHGIPWDERYVWD